MLSPQDLFLMGLTIETIEEEGPFIDGIPSAFMVKSEKSTILFTDGILTVIGEPQEINYIHACINTILSGGTR